MSTTSQLEQEFSLIQVLDIKLVSRLLTSFSIATDLGAVIAEADGSPISLAGINNSRHPACLLCQRVCSDKAGLRRCADSHANAGIQASQLGEPYIFRCHAGLIKWSAPIVFQSKYLGSVLCGPVLMWDPDELAITEICTRLSDLGIPEDEMRSLATGIKVMSGPNVQAAAELLFVISNQLAQSGMTTLLARRELNTQQARLAEEIYARKKAEEIIKDVEARAKHPVYPLEKEQDLLARVKLGDRQGAKEILNELLGSIFFRTGCSTEVIKARVLELMVVLSRAAVEAGASLEKLLGLNFNYVKELYDIQRFEELCAWIVKVLDTFLDVAAENRDMKNAKVIQDAVEYITTNYNRELTLDEVASTAHVSPYYLSHLFRSELDCTFVEYMTKCRIENAKRLMKGTNLTLTEICDEVGYKDSSYFSKVFKKTEGVIPSKYRQHLAASR